MILISKSASRAQAAPPAAGRRTSGDPSPAFKLRRGVQGPGDPLEQRLSLVTLAATDLPALTAFYEKMGWKAGFRNEEVTFFQLNGVVLSLWRRDRFAHETGVPEDRLGPGGTEIAYNVRARPEVDDVMRAAVAAGGRVVAPARDAVWGGHSGHFADPEGHLWEVAWNPDWTVAADGGVRF